MAPQHGLSTKRKANESSGLEQLTSASALRELLSGGFESPCSQGERQGQRVRFRSPAVAGRSGIGSGSGKCVTKRKKPIPASVSRTALSFASKKDYRSAAVVLRGARGSYPLFRRS